MTFTATNKTWAFLSFVFLAANSHAADWPQWLGPNRDGSTPEIVKPWTGQLKVIWRAKVGDGHSAPVVAGNLVILHAADTTGAADAPELKAKLEYVTAYNAATGVVRWVGRMDKKPFHSEFGDGPRATPAIADGRVYALGVTGTLAAFDLASGKLMADQVDLVEEYKAKIPRFGVSASPLVDGDKVWVLIGGPEAGLAARNAMTLKPAGKALTDPASYAAPIVTGQGGQRQIIALTANAVYGVPPTGGAPFWRFRFYDLLSESSATPVRARDLIVASSVTLGSVGLKMIEKDGKPAVEKSWINPSLTCYFSTPVAVGKELYMVTGRLPPFASATLNCVDSETGKVLWSRPKVGTYGATLVRTGDNKLLMLEEFGNLVLIDANRDKYVELARSKICGETWAHFAVAGGRLYARDKNELICIELPTGAKATSSP